MNPSWQQEKLREFCKQKGIHVSAWSALGAYKIFWGSGAVMENPILQDIAKAKGKTTAQVNFQQKMELLKFTYSKKNEKIEKLLLMT